MRFIIVLLLLSLAHTVFADGCALSPEYLESLKETDQLALIDLGHDGATVDMFIAIDGIPAGKTITYVLPFWHKPEGFSLEETDSKRFREQRLKLVEHRIDWENRRFLAPCSTLATSAILMLGAIHLGPFSPWAGMQLFPKLFVLDYGMMAGSSQSMQPALIPYQSASTPQVRAELYRVEEKDLQVLVVQAGLPEKYAAVLRRYRTNYYAIMHLTGVARRLENEKNGAPNSYGIHYHFRHPMAEADSYTYTYPLGTGGAWPQPILLTEVYLTCPLDSYMHVSAPVIGENYSSAGWHDREYQNFLEQAQFMRNRLEYKVDTKKDLPTTEPDAFAMTGTRLIQLSPHPTAWHRAYCYTNPTEDVVVDFAPRPYAFLFQLAIKLSMQPALQVILIVLALIFSWVVALRGVLLPRWKSAGKPKTFRHYVLRTIIIIVTSSLAFSLYILLTANMMFHTLPTVIIFKDISDFLSAVNLPLVFAITIPVLVVAVYYALRWPVFRHTNSDKTLVQLTGFTAKIILYPLAFLLIYPFCIGMHFSPSVATICFCFFSLFGWLAVVIRLDDKLPKGSIALTWLTVMGVYVLCSIGLWGVAVGIDHLLQG